MNFVRLKIPKSWIAVDSPWVSWARGGTSDRSSVVAAVARSGGLAFMAVKKVVRVARGCSSVSETSDGLES